MGAEIRLGEGDGNGGIGWKIERWVSFSPVPGSDYVSGVERRWELEGRRGKGGGGGRGKMGWAQK